MWRRKRRDRSHGNSALSWNVHKQSSEKSVLLLFALDQDKVDISPYYNREETRCDWSTSDSAVNRFMEEVKMVTVTWREARWIVNRAGMGMLARGKVTCQTEPGTRDLPRLLTQALPPIST